MPRKFIVGGNFKVRKQLSLSLLFSLTHFLRLLLLLLIVHTHEHSHVDVTSCAQPSFHAHTLITQHLLSTCLLNHCQHYSNPLPSLFN